MNKDTTQPREQAKEDQFIIDAVTRANVKFVHPGADTTRDIGRAVLAAYRATQQAAPEAPTSEQHPWHVPFNPNADCSPTLTQCPRCNNPWNACDRGVVTTASASAVTDAELADPEYMRAYVDELQATIGQLTRCAPAPSRNAAPQIATWRERYEEAGHAEGGEFYMEAEINDLRAALTQQSTAVAPSHEAREKLLTEIQAALDSLADTKMTTYTYTSMANVLHHCRDAITGKGYYGAAQASHAGADTEDAARFQRAIALEDNAETLYAAVLSHAPDTAAIRRDFDAALAATEKKEQK